MFNARLVRTPSLATAFLATLLGTFGCSADTTESDGAALGMTSDATVKVHVIDDAGTLVGPVATPRIEKSADAWRAELTEEQFHILRESGTEYAGTGALLDNKAEGVYVCAGCGLPLYSSDTKFKSGTGWPSFYDAIAAPNVATKEDRSHGMTRVEINCARCDGHLGHVFDDGPRPTGKRHCVNSAALDFIPKDKLTMTPGTGPRATAVFAGGCFWCTEAVFEELEGVISAESGYAGGAKETADYKTVCSGRTKHAEAIRITYDPTVIPYEALLHVHFATHDPTQLNRQGNDIGPQYRSAIFVTTDDEEKTVRRVMGELKDENVFSGPIVTTVERGAFYPAEAEHQNFVCENPTQGYVMAVAMPKVEKVRKLFKERLKKESPLKR